MTEPSAIPAAAEAHAAPDDHHADAHDGALGHDAAGHRDERLGPIDWPAWGAGALGVALGLAVAIVFAVTTGLLGG